MQNNLTPYITLFHEYNSNAWMYTFEFWISNNRAYVNYNNSGEMLLLDLLQSKLYPEVKSLLKEITEEIIITKRLYNKIDFSKSWEKILLEFIQHYLFDKDQILDVTVKSNGSITFNLEEAVKAKYVIRNGKKIKKYTTDSSNKKLVKIPGKPNAKPKEVTMTSKERINREKGAKKASRKAKAKSNQANLKRKKSLRKRTWD